MRDVRLQNATCGLVASEIHEAMPALLDLLGDRRTRLAFLTTHSATLEDVFVALTGTAPARCLSRASIPLVELTTARLREFLREPEAVFWVFAFPLLMAFALGIAFRAGAHPGRRGRRRALGGDATLVQRLEARQRACASASSSRRTPTARCAAGRSRSSWCPARRWSTASIRPAREPDGARSSSTTRCSARAGRADPVSSRDDDVVAPGSRYIDWLVPGLLGMNIMGTGLWSIGFSVVVARSRKLLKRLMATPMPRGAVPRVASARAAGVPRARSGGAAGLRLARLRRDVGRVAVARRRAGAARRAGLLGARPADRDARATTIEGVSGLMNVVMLPMWLLSGVFFASSNFPDVAQPFIRRCR